MKKIISITIFAALFNALLCQTAFAEVYSNFTVTVKLNKLPFHGYGRILSIKSQDGKTVYWSGLPIIPENDSGLSITISSIDLTSGKVQVEYSFSNKPKNYTKTFDLTAANPTITISY